MVLVRRWRPFLARLKQLDKGKENNSNLTQFKIATSQKSMRIALTHKAVQIFKRLQKVGVLQFYLLIRFVAGFRGRYQVG